MEYDLAKRWIFRELRVRAIEDFIALDSDLIPIERDKLSGGVSAIGGYSPEELEQEMFGDTQGVCFASYANVASIIADLYAARACSVYELLQFANDAIEGSMVFLRFVSRREIPAEG